VTAPKDFILVKDINPAMRAVFLEPPAWTRLEPQSISGDPSPGMEARVHDPLWFLARQWQLAEFEGEDTGTPLIMHMKTKTLPVTAWQPGDPANNRPARAIEAGVPLDPLVENEPSAAPQIGLRQRAEAGAYLLELLADSGMDARAGLVGACPLDVTPPPANATPSEQFNVSDAFRIIASTTPDGVLAAAQLEAGAPGWLSGASAEAQTAAARWMEWFRANVLPPARDPADDSWIGERLEYRFSIGVGGPNEQRVLRAPLHEGGEIDWFTFDHDPNGQLALEGEEVPAAQELDLNVMATPLRFTGMPADRYWQYEDGQVNFGGLDAQPHDLARLCVSEFAIIYGNDWLVVPLNVQAGAFTQIIEVAYTDTFGERINVPPADEAGRGGRFSMFEMSVRDQENATLPGLLVAPTALGTLEGRALEAVHFLRDEQANMVWAIERAVQARTGDPRSRGDEERVLNTVEKPFAAGAELQYLLQTQVPHHWIPFVPIATGVGTTALRKGTTADDDLSLGVLLHPTPLTIRDEEIPREGVQVRRVPALARASDGRYLRWIARRTSIGRGQGSSGLAFDGAYSF
jgi:hypothetical protein